MALCVWCTASKLSWFKCGVVLQSSAYEETSSTCQCTDHSSTEERKRVGLTHVCLGSEKESLQLDWELAKWEKMVKCREGQTILMGEQERMRGLFWLFAQCWVLSRNSGQLHIFVVVGQHFSHLKSSCKLPFQLQIPRYELHACLLFPQDLDWTDKVQFLLRMAFKM